MIFLSRSNKRITTVIAICVYGIAFAEYLHYAVNLYDSTSKSYVMVSGINLKRMLYLKRMLQLGEEQWFEPVEAVDSDLDE